jgi:hypothetical protein
MRCRACARDWRRKQQIVRWAQAGWRQRESVAHLEALKFERAQFHSRVAIVQKTARRKAATRKCQKLRAHKRHKQEKMRGAVHIQKVVRGVQGRAYAAKRRERLQERQRQSAALQIQTARVRYKYRLRKRRAQAAGLIQTRWRGRLGRKRAQERLRRLHQRFTCGNCGHYEPGGVYCKKCGRRRARPGTFVKSRVNQAVSECRSMSPSRPKPSSGDFDRGTSTNTRVSRDDDSYVALSRRRRNLNEIQTSKHGPKVEKMYLPSASGDLPPVNPTLKVARAASRGKDRTSQRAFPPQIHDDRFPPGSRRQSDVIRQSDSAPASIGVRSRERAQEVKRMSVAKTTERQMETLKGLKETLDRRRQVVER